MSKSELMTAARSKVVLTALGKREKVLEAQIQAVAHGYTNACFVYGPGGLGKTHLITGTLDALLGGSWYHHTAFSTPKGLMLSLAERPESIHLFEDCETLYKSDVASSILRAACGAPKQKERWVVYETAHETLRVNFRGGIIIVSNEALTKAKGPLAAVASRFRPVKWDMSIEERIARILHMAEAGWERGEWKLTPAECKTVAKYLVNEMCQGESDVAVDLRTFSEHALPAFAQHKSGKSSVDWTEVLRSKLQGQVSGPERRGERGSRLETIALALSLDKTLNTSQRGVKWKEQTGLGLAIYYRHLQRAKSGGK
jgi:hypothetical protein